MYGYALDSPTSTVDPEGLDIINLSGGPVFVLPEKKGDPICVLPPGATYKGTHDGLAFAAASPGSDPTVSTFKTSGKFPAGQANAVVVPQGAVAFGNPVIMAVQNRQGGTIPAGQVGKHGSAFQQLQATALHAFTGGNPAATGFPRCGCQ